MQGRIYGFSRLLFAQANSHLAALRPRPALNQNFPEFAPVFGKPGATEQQLAAVEHHIGQALPEDLRWLAANTFDPSGYLFRWVLNPSEIAIFRDWVRDGIEVDVRAGLWLTMWGSPPGDIDARVDRFRREFDSWPKLIPLKGHRALVVEPVEVGNPVFSVMQSDIIQYGHDLANWIAIEFTSHTRYEDQRFDKRIPYWSRFGEMNSDFCFWNRPTRQQ